MDLSRTLKVKMRSQKKPFPALLWTSIFATFIEKVIKTAGFPRIMQTWFKILLKGFRSHINHAGNLLKLIQLGRGARQGDPIASILFVIAIEILLIAIRNNTILDGGVAPHHMPNLCSEEPQ